MRRVGRSLRRMALGAALVVPALVVAPAVVAHGPTACAAAASDGPHAGLVVDTGGGATTYCVALDGDTVNGLHLIALASAQYGLSYRLGFGGLAVCQLEGVGPDGDDCFADYPDFWGYWHHTGTTGWAWASTGAGTAQVGDGDMDAWTWGSGDTGDTHPAPPALAFEDVCVPASEPPPTTPPPTPKPKPTHPPTTPPSGAGGRGAGGTGTTAPPRTTAPRKTQAASESTAPSESPSAAPGGETSAGASASPAVAVAADPAAGSGAGGTPWLGALLALAAVAVFVVGGLVRLRAGRSGRGAAPGP